MSSTILYPLDSGDCAWVLSASALVMIMTPGLGFFYGGMVKKNNMLSTIAYCFIVFAEISILWALIAFSLVYAPTSNGFIGNLDYAAMIGVGGQPNPAYATTIPFALYFFYQLVFAGITPAIILGSMVERVKLGPLLIFIAMWLLLVYCPIAHWMWNPQGWAFKLGVLDFAGGNVVHVSSGVAGLAAAIVIGQREDNNSQPCSISLTLLGCALLWFGWFGFNGGAALKAGALASSAVVSTNLSAAAAGLSWMACQSFHGGQASILGFASGSVCGLVSITPGSGYVPPWSSIIIGLGGGAASYFFCHYRSKLKLFKQIDDTLDVFGCHGICGIWGGIATGLFSQNSFNPAISGTHDGAFYNNGIQLGYQLAGICASIVWSFGMTIIILLILKYTIKLTVSKNEEQKGLDIAIHKEENDPLNEKVRDFMEKFAKGEFNGMMRYTISDPQDLNNSNLQTRHGQNENQHGNGNANFVQNGNGIGVNGISVLAKQPENPRQF